MKRVIIENQTVEARVQEVCAELEILNARQNLQAAAQIIIDLELLLRDSEADLARLESQQLWPC